MINQWRTKREILLKKLESEKKEKEKEKPSNNDNVEKMIEKWKMERERLMEKSKSKESVDSNEACGTSDTGEIIDHAKISNVLVNDCTDDSYYSQVRQREQPNIHFYQQNNSYHKQQPVNQEFHRFEQQNQYLQQMNLIPEDQYAIQNQYLSDYNNNWATTWQPYGGEGSVYNFNVPQQYQQQNTGTNYLNELIEKMIELQQQILGLLSC